MIPAESAHDTIGALGEVGLLQFKDLNADKSAFQRTYANQVGAERGYGILMLMFASTGPPDEQVSGLLTLRSLRAGEAMRRDGSQDSVLPRAGELTKLAI
jgi:hypothetical protein